MRSEQSESEKELPQRGSDVGDDPTSQTEPQLSILKKHINSDPLLGLNILNNLTTIHCSYVAPLYKTS